MSRINYKNYRGITLLARDLRKNQTSSEKLLWLVLRGKKFLGYKFLRQHPVFYRIDKGWVDFFIADFYCAKLKMIIELDGKIHEKQEAYDKDRDGKLEAKGFCVIRIKNEQLNDINNIQDYITEIVKDRARYLNDNQ